MGYIERNLIAGERVVYKTGSHPWLWIAPLLTTSLLLVAFQAALPILTEQLRRLPNVTNEAVSYLAFSGILIIVAGALNALGGFIRWLTDEISVTTLRIVSKRGWLIRRVTEVSLSKFEACEIAESLLGRLLGYKTLVVTGSGGTTHHFTMVRRARALRDHILAQAAAVPSAMQAERRSAPSRSALEDIFGATAPAEEVKRAAQLVQQNKRQEAAALVKGLAQQYPEDADVWYLVGLLQTDPLKQREAYQRALQINPNHRLARTALQKLGI
jgi:uncharacterized membrane protein YdbT with pleckstrin-like domain